MTAECAIGQNLPSFHSPGLPFWIPAFACLLQAGRNDNMGNRHGPTIFIIQRHFRPPFFMPAKQRCIAAH